MQPRFLETIKIDVTEKKATLICKCSVSDVTATWFKDGRVLEQEEKYEIRTSSDGTITLCINDISTTDQGLTFLAL